MESLRYLHPNSTIGFWKSKQLHYLVTVQFHNTDPQFLFSRESVGKQWKRWTKPSRKWRLWWEWMSKTKSNKLRHWTTATPSPSWTTSTATAPCPPHRSSPPLHFCSNWWIIFVIRLDSLKKGIHRDEIERKIKFEWN